MIPDLQSLIDSTAPHIAAEENPPTDLPGNGWNVSTLNTLFYDAYQPLQAMWDFGSALADKWPDYVTGLEIGTTAEGRPIRGWSAKLPMNEGETDPHVEFIIQSGQHAREVGSTQRGLLMHSGSGRRRRCTFCTRCCWMLRRSRRARPRRCYGRLRSRSSRWSTPTGMRTRMRRTACGRRTGSRWGGCSAGVSGSGHTTAHVCGARSNSVHGVH